jgi:outer membrane protein assembly factor BamB
MRINPSRRAFIKLAAAGLLIRSAVPVYGAASLLRTSKSWQTGNALLRPLSMADGRVHFCGNAHHGAIDPARGIVWTRPLEFGLAAQFRPRLANGRVAIGGHGGISMHNAETGDLLWAHQAKLQIGTPLLVGDTLHCGEGHEMTAFDAASGAVKWRFAGIVDTLASYAPLLIGNQLFAGPGDGRLYALDAENGTLLWQVDRNGEWQYLRQLHAEGGTIVAGSYKEKLFGISAADGKALWEFNAGNFINSHVVADGLAYLWSPTGWIFAVDTATGAVRWRHETTDYDNTSDNWASLMAELVVADGKLYALDMKDELHVLDAKTGASLQRLQVPAAIQHAILPAMSDALFFPTKDGAVLMTETAA